MSERVPEGWKRVKLGKVVVTNPENIGKNYPYNEILYLDTGSIKKGQIEALQIFQLIDAPSRAKRLVKNEDIIYSTVRPIQRHYGFITNPPKNLVVSTGFVVIRVKPEEAVPKFIYYFLTLDETVEILDAIAEGSTSAYPSLRPSDIENLEIEIPKSLDEQRSIASVLSSLDDKIDLLHRQNKTLEAMAETLFRQWFIEEAKEDWEEGKLGDVVKVKRGGSPRPIQNYITSKGGYNWLKISDATREESPFIFDIKEQIKREGLNKTILLKKGSLVLSNSATPGIPKILQVDTCIHDGWLYFPDSYFSVEFLYLLFKTIRNDLLVQGNGSIFTNLKTDILKNYRIQIPPRKWLMQLQIRFAYFFEKILINRIQIRTLENLRDTLLPKLMSGEVRVRY